jgi:GTP-binding protein Era
MVESARAALDGVDLVLMVADASRRPDDEDKEIAKLLGADPGPTRLLLCLNKMDILHAEYVVENVEAYCKLFGTEDYMLTTATKGQNVDKLLELIVERLPEGEPAFPVEDFTDQSSRFMAAELVREKILQATRQEVPHATAVLVDNWEEPETGAVRISASIIVEKPSQRAILIGKQGQFIKRIGTQARLEIEALIGRQVFLELFVKVREDWRMNPGLLHELEYME